MLTSSILHGGRQPYGGLPNSGSYAKDKDSRRQTLHCTRAALRQALRETLNSNAATIHSCLPFVFCLRLFYSTPGCQRALAALKVLSSLSLLLPRLDADGMFGQVILDVWDEVPALHVRAEHLWDSQTLGMYGKGVDCGSASGRGRCRVIPAIMSRERSAESWSTSNQLTSGVW